MANKKNINNNKSIKDIFNKKSFKNGDGLFFGLLEVAFSVDVLSKLSQTQLEILSYLVVEEISPIEIHKRRGTSIQAVRKVIKKLREYGLINKLNRPNTDIIDTVVGESKNGGGYLSNYPNDSDKKYRLHGQNMTIKILKTSRQYWKILSKETQKPIKNNTVQLYRNKIVIYSKTSFYDNEVDDCFEQSDTYWTQFFRILENELGINIINGKYTNIYQFRCHVAKVGDPFAKKVIKEKLKYKVIDDLGRVRLLVDNSKGLFEKESVDNRLCQEDMKRLGDFELDYIEMEEPLKLSDVATFMKSSVPLLNQTNIMGSKIDELSRLFPLLSEYSRNLQLHMEVQNNQLKTQKQMQKLLKQIQNGINK